MTKTRGATIARKKDCNMNPYLHINRIEFVVTWRCTGRCRHCSVGDMADRTGGADHLPAEAAARVVREAADLYPLRSVMTFGGEPLLHADVTCAIHRAARDAGVPARQIITNGYFSRDKGRIREVAEALADAGVNDLLLSVDAFHQETIPLEIVRAFAHAVKAAGIEKARLQPAWVVNREHDNPYNARTRDILESLADTGLPAHYGNDIFLAGNAARHLADFYPPPRLDPADCCGRAPYTAPLDDVRSLSINPDGDVMVCCFPIGNVLRENLADIVGRYDPRQDEGMRAAMAGVPGLLALAEKWGLPVDPARCNGVCDLCKQVNR